MVFTSRNKSWKILSCLSEIVFFYSDFFAGWRKPLSKLGSQFLKKNVFAPSENCFFHLPDIPGCEKVFPSSGNVFFNEFFVPASGHGFSF